jgi:hypothetical protein
MDKVAETPRFLIRLPADLRAELEALAQAEGRSLSNMIVRLLKEALAARRRGTQSPRPDTPSNEEA